MIDRQKLVATDYEVRLLKEISDHLREHSYDDYPSITIYYQILMTFVENDNDEHFGKLKNYSKNIPINFHWMKQRIFMPTHKTIPYAK